jgi:uncharacterized coiled-coil protein SlyX
MNEDENIVEKLMEKADRMLDRLTEALTDEDDDALAAPLMVYVTAKFTAGILLGLQETTYDYEIFDKYTIAVKELMSTMGKDMRVQSIKNKIAENEKFIEKAKQVLAEKEKKIAALEREYKQEARLRKLHDDDDGIVN